MVVRRISNNELYHHGVKGQKWGVRRYQNPDGTLTDAGRKRYGIDEDGKLSVKGQKNLYRDVKKDIKKHDKLLKRELHVGDQLHAQVLGKAGSKVASKQEAALFKKRSEINAQKNAKLDSVLKNNVSDKEKKQLQKLIKKYSDLEFALDEGEWGTPKYEKLIKQSEETRTEISKMYSTIGKRVVGKNWNKKVSGSKFWGTEKTMTDVISSRLWVQAVDELIEKDEW